MTDVGHEIYTFDTSTDNSLLEIYEYVTYVRDFRSVSGLMGFGMTDWNNSVGGGFDDGPNMFIEMIVTPIYENGTADADADGVYCQLYKNNGRQEAIISDNYTHTIDFATIDSTDDEIRAEVGYNFYWASDNQLVGSMQFYNFTTDKLETVKTYGEYSTAITRDVKIEVVMYAADSVYNNTGRMYLKGTSWQTGQGRAYFEPELPTPELPYIPPPPTKTGWFDFGSNIFQSVGDFIPDIGGGISYVINQIVSTVTDIFSGIGDLITAIGALASAVGTAIFNVFEDWVIPFVQTIATAIFDWILDTFNLRDLYEQSVSLFEFVHAILVLIWLFLVFLCSSFPFARAALLQNGDYVLNDYWNIWSFDLTFGASVLGIRIPVPLIIVTVFFTIIVAATYQIDWVLTLFPWA